MVLLVIWLFIETRRAETHTLWKERCSYAIVTTFFGLSYIGRYVNNEYIFGVGDSFADYVITIVVYLFEGMSMGVLMLFHFMNFRQGSSILKSGEGTSVLIMRSEFDTEEVNTT